MKLNTNNLVFQGLNDWNTVDFSKVKTIKQLKKTIVYNYVMPCRKCLSENFCIFHDSSEPPCPMLERVVNNYIDTTIKSIDTENRYFLMEYIKSVILLTQLFKDFEIWRGMYVDDWYNRFFESLHPRLNSHYSHDLLVTLSKFVRAYDVVKTDRIMHFSVLVEGDSEFEALPPIFSALGVLGIGHDSTSSVRFHNLKGKDSVQREKIKDHLGKFKDLGVSYFLILDNDKRVKEYINDLKREGLLEESHYIVWDNKFEDNFGEEAILKVLKGEEEQFGNIAIDELKQCNSEKKDIEKSINYLLRKKNIALKFSDFKVRIAKKLSEWTCREINESMRTSSGSYIGSRTPKSTTFPEFVEKLRNMAEEIERISSEFHRIPELE